MSHLPSWIAVASLFAALSSPGAAIGGRMASSAERPNDGNASVIEVEVDHEAVLATRPGIGTVPLGGRIPGQGRDGGLRLLSPEFLALDPSTLQMPRDIASSPGFVARRQAWLQHFNC